MIDETGKQIGVIDTRDALVRAQAAHLDLVVVSENANPPVAKIIHFQKFKYQESKKLRSGTAKNVETKEVRFTPFMAANDFNTRVERAKEFLADGHRVKLVVKFVGRQITRKEFGVSQMDQAIAALSVNGTPDSPPKWQGKIYVTQLKPLKQPKKNEKQN